MPFGFAGLKGPYAVFIIVLMVLGVLAAGFFFYNTTTQNPCGDPGAANFSALPDMTVDVGGQPRNYHAVAANFTKTNQLEAISNVTFLTTEFNDPLQPHLINGACGSDPNSAATITVSVTFRNTGLRESLSLSFRGTSYSSTQEALTNNSEAGLLWNPGSISLTLLVAV